jgi:hypothetical protein
MRQMALNLVGTLTASILLAVACPIGALARSMDGGTSGGGGAIVYSEAKDIKATLAKIYKVADKNPQSGDYAAESILSKALAAFDSRRGEINDPQLKSIFKKMFGRLEFAALVNAVTWVTKYDLQDQACIDKEGQARAASVVAVNLGKDWPRSSSEFDRGDADPKKFSVKLCYSVSELVKIPRANLEQQLIVLTIHELTHVFGYDETVAVKVQNFLLESGRQLVNTQQDSLDRIRDLVNVVGMFAYSVEESLGGTDVRTCLAVGQFYGALSIMGMHIEELQIKGEESGRPLKLTPKIFKTLDGIQTAAEVLDGYCGGEGMIVRKEVKDPKNPAYSTVEGEDKSIYRGDRAAVKKNLEYIYNAIEKLQDQLKMNTMNY